MDADSDEVSGSNCIIRGGIQMNFTIDYSKTFKTVTWPTATAAMDPALRGWCYAYCLHEGQSREAGASLKRPARGHGDQDATLDRRRHTIRPCVQRWNPRPLQSRSDQREAARSKSTMVRPRSVGSRRDDRENRAQRRSRWEKAKRKTQTTLARHSAQRPEDRWPPPRPRHRQSEVARPIQKSGPRSPGQMLKKKKKKTFKTHSLSNPNKGRTIAKVSRIRTKLIFRIHPWTLFTKMGRSGPAPKSGRG